MHPALRITGITAQTTLIDNTLVRERVLAVLSGFFSMVAIGLVAVGLYGVVAYGVVQRTREIGIRVALGALPLSVVGMVVTETAVMTLVGLVLGLAAGLVASRFVLSLLYEVTPAGGWSITAPLLCLLVAGSLSALLPASRAARVDPVKALQS